MVVLQVPGDGMGAGVETFLREAAAEVEDEVDGRRGQRVGADVGFSGVGFEGCIALDPPETAQPLETP